jgi:hypothetical protein
MATTTNYSWTTPDNTAYVKDGASAIRTLGSSVDTTLFNITNGKNVGLVPILTTTFSSIASTNISSIFSATYDNYRILVNIAQNSTFSANYIQLRIGATTVTNNYDRRGVFLNSGSTVSGSGTAAESTLLIGQTGNGGRSFHTIDFANPFLTVPTIGTVVAADNESGGGRDMFLSSIYNSNSTSYDSLVLGCSAGTITGTIRVYGYRNS